LKGVLGNLVRGGVSLLQYADDTNFMFKDSLAWARNLKIILCLFKLLIGLKINFHKSELFCFGDAQSKNEDYATIFTCV
jgi:hypothetical protein